MKTAVEQALVAEFFTLPKTAQEIIVRAAKALTAHEALPEYDSVPAEVRIFSRKVARLAPECEGQLLRAARMIFELHEFERDLALALG